MPDYTFSQNLDLLENRLNRASLELLAAAPTTSIIGRTWMFDGTAGASALHPAVFDAVSPQTFRLLAAVNRVETITALWTLNPPDLGTGNGQRAPFVVGALSAYDPVNRLRNWVQNLNSDYLDGYDASAAAAADTIAVRIGAGRLKVGTPTENDDATHKQYVDNAASGIRPVTGGAVRAATVSSFPGTYSSANGGTVLADANNPISAYASVFDGVTLVLNDRVLLRATGNAPSVSSGIFSVTDAGSGATRVELRRTSDADQPGEVTTGAFVQVTAGTTNAGSRFRQGLPVANIHTDNEQWSLHSTSEQLTGGRGIFVSGQQIHFAQTSDYTPGNLPYASSGTGITMLPPPSGVPPVAAPGSARWFLSYDGPGTKPNWAGVHWVDIVNKPATFTPSAHDHVVSDLLTSGGNIQAVPYGSGAERYTADQTKLKFDGSSLTIGNDGTATTATVAFKPLEIGVYNSLLTMQATGTGPWAAQRVLVTAFLANNGIITASQAITINAGAGISIAETATQNLTGTPLWTIVNSSPFPGYGTPAAGSVKLTAAAGVATTVLRSDAVLALDQSIAPTWTGKHTFNSAVPAVALRAGVATLGATSQMLVADDDPSTVTRDVKGTGLAAIRTWLGVPSGGAVAGTGTAKRVPLWSGASGASITLTDSIILQDAANTSVDVIGRLGINVVAPAAQLDLAAGTAALAPVRFGLPAVLLTTPITGAFEVDSVRPWFSDSSANRHGLAFIDDLDFSNDPNAAMAGAVRFQGDAGFAGATSTLTTALGASPWTMNVRCLIPRTLPIAGTFPSPIALYSATTPDTTRIFVFLGSDGNLQLISRQGVSGNDAIILVTGVGQQYAGRILDITAVKASTGLTLYLGGVVVATSTDAKWQRVLDGATELRIANDLGTGASNTWSERIYSAQLYNTALSGFDVRSLVRAGVDHADKWAGQTELIGDPGFDNASKWFAAAGSQITASVGRWTGAIPNTRLSLLADANSPLTVPGKRYRATYSVSSWVAGSVALKQNTNVTIPGAAIAGANGPYSAEWVALPNVGVLTAMEFRAQTTATLDVDSLTMQQTGCIVDLDFGVGCGSFAIDRSGRYHAPLLGTWTHVIGKCPLALTLGNVTTQMGLRKYVVRQTTITDGGTVVVTHNLGTRDVAVTTYRDDTVGDATPPEVFAAPWQCTNDNMIQVFFGKVPAGSPKATIVVIG
jgi:hypothetical protein